MGRSGGRRDGQYCENIPCQSSLSSHLASPDLVDIEPAGCPAAAPGVVVLGPQVVAGQRGVEHPRCEIYPALWRCKMFSYPTSHLTLKQIFVPGMKYNGKVCYVERSHLSQVSASHPPPPQITSHHTTDLSREKV